MFASLQARTCFRLDFGLTRSASPPTEVAVGRAEACVSCYTFPTKRELADSCVAGSTIRHHNAPKFAAMSSGSDMSARLSSTILVSLTLAGLVSPTAFASDPADTSGMFTLDVSGYTRWRYETTDGRFRGGREGSDQAVSGRTLLTLSLDSEPVDVTVEFVDSRVYFEDEGSPLSVNNVNTFDILEANAAFNLDGLMGEGRGGYLKLGRMTQTYGSRRLAGRNGYRNTINAFTGAEWQVEGADDWSLRTFYVVPIDRFPNDRASLSDNQQDFDEENWDQQFWGTFLNYAPDRWNASLDLYLFGLTEQDTEDRPTADRELFTPGVRYFRAPSAGVWDFDFEYAYQFGERRAGRDDTTPMLDVSASMLHAEVGYSFQTAWSPRVSLEAEWATGDEDAADDEWGRFDPLYGLRRRDFGQTGIAGPLRRQNVQALGWRVSGREGDFRFMFLHKAAWLDSESDLWRDAGLIDASGQSGDFLGHHLDARFYYSQSSTGIDWEWGTSSFVKGEFAEEAPGASTTGNTLYGYLMAIYRF